ncbi:MAG: PAS domain-containing protein [Lentisphaerae bacterium]|nr:PAS domain-containing protein [Lentisphaerota bacterium]
MKSGFLDKLIERLDKLDPQSLQTHFLHLVREKGLLEAVFNALQEGVIVLDARGNISYANQAAAQMLGEWSKLISREIEIKYPEHRFLSCYVMPLPPMDDQERGAVVIFRDITCEREQESRTLNNERLNALTLLAAGVAHEIGNPLNSLHIHLQLLERGLRKAGLSEGPKLRDLVQVSRAEVERLNLIITQFLRAIRPSAPQREQCSLEEVLQEILQFMTNETRNRDVVVDLKTSEPIPNISIDRNQIKQAFFNIIKNALQSMSRGGLLTVTLFTSDHFAGVSFKDTGEGIPADKITSIFQPYQTSKTEGSGLGLMIVQRIVQDHGGEIEIHSQPGVGTTFTVLLPLDARRIRLLKAPRRTCARRPAEEDNAS